MCHTGSTQDLIKHLTSILVTADEKSEQLLFILTYLVAFSNYDKCS